MGRLCFDQSNRWHPFRLHVAGTQPKATCVRQQPLDRYVGKLGRESSIGGYQNLVGHTRDAVAKSLRISGETRWIIGGHLLAGFAEQVHNASANGLAPIVEANSIIIQPASESGVILVCLDRSQPLNVRHQKVPGLSSAVGDCCLETLDIIGGPLFKPDPFVSPRAGIIF